VGGPDEVTVTVRAPWPRADRRPVVLSVEGMCPDEVTVSVRALWSVLRAAWSRRVCRRAHFDL